METTRQSIQDALDSNLATRATIEKQLELVLKKKRRNRLKAAQIIKGIPVAPKIDSNDVSDAQAWAFFDNVPSFNEQETQAAQLLPPIWTDKEMDTMHKFAESTANTDDGALDFETVAAKLNKKLKTNRTAEECRNQYEPDRSPFTKEEKAKALKQLHSNQQPSLPNRTKWQAFQAAQSSTKVPWTIQEEELLFTAIAAAGPQVVIDQRFAAQFSGVLQKTPKSILQRCTQSLLNPRFANSAWTKEDEMKLCLAMKVYSEEAIPMTSVSALFPDRAARSINDKWTRTLDPSKQQKKSANETKFTPQQDEMLLEVGSSGGWEAAAENVLLAGKSPKSLSKRWSQIAPSDQVFAQYKRKLILKRKFEEYDEDDVVVRLKTTGER